MAGPAGPLPAPRHAPGPDGPWEQVREELAATGSCVLYGTLATWSAHLQEPERLRPVLGRDWSRYESLTPARGKERFLASRVLLRQTAAAAIGTVPELVDLAYHPGGRPYVRGCDQIDISLSHTEEVLVVGVTSRGRIGVDVELADRRMAGTASETQGYTTFELARLDEEPASRRNDLLVRLWTLKEAYSKALGVGLRFRFTEFGFALDGRRGARLVQPDGEPVAGGSAWSFATFGVRSRYVVSLAVFDAGFGGSSDLSVDTALDEGLLDTLLRATERS
ncbi:4'-phosphopantetheinyl transferase family protein [Kitasatospora camelliae]|uniref:4'-phosphopantetheinyl transferase superfamily protein n=1 Tax=Kitasatospora camelliae TaxID=3156397 RepID=A0AAU8K245_9ACTN